MDATTRILDANLNRAREGLRVMEDVARLGLDRRELCELLKGVRHEVTRASELLGVDALARLAARDSLDDVGAELPAPAATAGRATLAGMVDAGAGRAGEALRVLEECAKVLHANEASHAFVRARFRLYEAHKRLALELGAGRARQWTLCVLLTQALCAHHAWERVAELALEGGADCVQLREKDLSDRDLLARARRLVAIARPFGATVFINDRPDIALLARAHGVHLGQHDLSVRDARALVGGRLLIGVSTSCMREAREARRDGADVCGVGPMFMTSTKHKPVIAGPTYLREYLNDPTTEATPHLAIGGINNENIHELVRAGCRGVAVSSSVCGSGDVRAECEGLVAALHRAQKPNMLPQASRSGRD